MRCFFVLLFVPLFLQNAFTQAVPAVPDSIKAPGDVKLVLQGHASGDQIYVCQPMTSGNSKLGWVLSGPEATLVDAAGTEVAKHFAGPTWQAIDGSQVEGKVAAQVAPDQDSIPWLLLTAVDHAGAGVLSDVVAIQRINTKGGKAPANGCDAQHQGDKMRVPYVADYYFYTSVK